MTALNERETAEIREAIDVIQHVLRNGYDPEKAAENDIPNTRSKISLERSNKQLLTIVQMKGYYPL